MSDNEVQQPIPGEVRRSRNEKWMTFVLICGVILPVAAVVVELLTRVCSTAFFDPLPTVWHVAMFLLIPISNLAVMITYRRGESSWAAALTLLSGAAVGISGAYSLYFLPLLPISLIGTVFAGIGICGLAPFFALGAAVICTRRLDALGLVIPKTRLRLVWAGFAIPVVIVLVQLAGAYITSAGLDMIRSDDSDARARGIGLIRTFGSKAALHRACYGLSMGTLYDYGTMSTSPWNNDARQSARETYYLVTGELFNATQPPKVNGMRSELVSDAEWDPDVGGEAVNSSVTGLSLSSSRVDGTIYPDSLTSYTEWTMIFSNKTTTQREARALVGLPPGGVVSRVTLWINGEPREAAFGGKGQVREAYKQVAVVQQRDPVLVTSAGPDRVLVQCFPVPVDGKMKIRVGITAPLSTGSVYTLPHLVERNFAMPSNVKHSLYIESPMDIDFASNQTGVQTPGQDHRRIVATITDGEMRGEKKTVACMRSPVEQVWSPDPTDASFAIVQKVVGTHVGALGHMAVVIDSSKMMGPWMKPISESLPSLTATTFSAYVARDKVETLVPRTMQNMKASELLQKKVLGIKCRGGVDNGPALVEAVDQALRHQSAVVLWVHGPQPIDSDASIEQIRQRVERAPGRVKIYSLAVVDGKNTILTELDNSGAIFAVPRRGALGDDLASFFQDFVDDMRGIPTIVRERVPVSKVAGMQKAPDHVAKLWALGEVRRMCASDAPGSLAKAARFATAHHLVTPVSGAVVLESKEQYDAAGLKPVDDATASNVTPEPASLLALAAGVGAVALGWRHRNKAA